MSTGEPRPSAPEPAAACERVWSAYARLQPLDPGDCGVVAGLSVAELQSWARSRPPAESVKVSLSAEEGPAPDEFTAYVRRFLTYGTPEWPERLARWPFPGPAARAKAESFEQYCGYLDRAVRDGDLPFPDPRTGRLASPSDAVHVYGSTVWSYFGDRLYMLFSGGVGSRAVGVLVPEENVLHDFDARLHRVVSAEGMANVVAQLLRRVVTHAERYRRALEDPARPGPRRVVLLAGKAQNPAHHLWNYYSGIERLVLAGLTPRVAEVRSAGSEFFGPVAGVFPELAGAEHERDSRGGVWDPHPFSADHLLVPAGGYLIPCSLADRLHLAMRDRPGSGAPEPARTSFGRPLVWIGLRLGDKSWADQEEEIPRLVRRLLEHHPRATVLLDGWSYPVAHDEVSEKWRAAIADLAALADGIVERSGRPRQVRSLVGNSLRESVLWAREVDAYVAPLGSSQHKVGWLTTAPGIVYVSPAVERLKRESLPGAYESECSALPRYVTGTVAGQGERRTAQDRRTNIENLHLDGAALADELLDLLASAPGDPGPSERTGSPLGRLLRGLVRHRGGPSRRELTQP